MVSLPSAAASEPAGAHTLATLSARPLALPTQIVRDGSTDGPDWRRVLAALPRYKWLVLAITAAGAAAGMLASRYVAPQYLAQANIVIDEHEQQGADRGPLQTNRMFDAEAWVDLLRSYAVLDTVVRELHLYLSAPTPAEASALTEFAVAPQFRPGEYRLAVDGAGHRYALDTKDGIALERGAVGDSIGLRLGFKWAPGTAVLWPGRRLAFTVATPRDAARRLGDALSVQIDQQGNFLKLELTGTDPQRVTAILNAVARRYASVAADLKKQKMSQVAVILAQQTGVAHDRLAEAEQGLEAFQARTAALPIPRGPAVAGGSAGAPASAAPGTPDPGNADFIAMVSRHDQMQADGATLRRILATTPDSELGVVLEGIPTAAQFPPLADALRDLRAKQDSLRSMQARYTDAYPPLQRVAGDIEALQHTALRQLTRQLEDRIDAGRTSAEHQITTAAAQLRSLPELGLEETRLRRSVTLADNLYSMLQQRLDEAQIAEVSTVPSVRVLDEAVTPQRPERNPAVRIMAVALIGSFAFALALAVLLDRFDPRFRYPEQVSRDLGLPILGAVPHLRHDGSGGPRLEDAAAFIEALRGVRMGLLSEIGGKKPVVFAVTSPGPGDGKSFLSANLARVFAEGGHRTVLVDADIRRGLQHRRFAMVRRPGLSDFLRGDAALAAIVQSTKHQGLDLVRCGMRSHDAPELLGTPLMARLVAELSSAYDVVLCDCPPLGAGVDPFVVGSTTGNMVLVVRSGVSHRELTGAKLEVLRRMPIRLVGAVLNDVPEGAVYGGYYSYYLPGYEAEDEPRPHRERAAVI